MRTTLYAARGGRLILTLMLLATIGAEVAFSWLGATGEHVFNPDWHPHARYHAAWTVAFVIALAVAGLWLLWRRAGDLHSATWTVATVGVLYWATEFFGFALPGTSASPDLLEPNTFPLLGLDIHGNLVFAAMMILLSVAGVLVARTGSRTQVGSAGARTGR